MCDDVFLETELADRITAEELAQIKRTINFSNEIEDTDYDRD